MTRCSPEPGSPISRLMPWSPATRSIPISSSIEPAGAAMIARRIVLLGAGAALLPVRGRAEAGPLRVACHEAPDPFWVRPGGLAIRILDEVVARRAECRLVYVPLPWERAIES